MLNAPSHLCKRAYPSVGRSVRIALKCHETTHSCHHAIRPLSWSCNHFNHAMTYTHHHSIMDLSRVNNVHIKGRVQPKRLFHWKPCNSLIHIWQVLLFCCRMYFCRFWGPLSGSFHIVTTPTQRQPNLNVVGGLTRKWLCKPHPTPPPPTPHKLNISNISAVTDPILTKL